MSRGQINFFDELIADNFVGGGGASTEQPEKAVAV